MQVKHPKSHPRRARRRSGAKALEVNPFAALVREVKPDVDARIEAVFDDHLARYGNDGVEVTETLKQARALSARGGKRQRAALVVAGQKAFERGRPARWDVAVECGVAVELLQSYFLIHDDWMDQDDTRRGGPAVHVALTKRFKSAHKGAAAAILAGDYLVALATERLVTATSRRRELPELVKRFSQMQLAAVRGQQLDVIGLTKSAERVYELKTASYTVDGPLQLGALLAGASAATQRRLSAFSIPVGVGFQLRDDLLGALGDPATTGKPRGNDILQGKWTWLVEHTMAHGTRIQRRSLRAALGNQQATAAQLEAATAALVDSGAATACETRIAELSNAAERALKRLRLTPKGHALLSGAMAGLLERKS